MALTGSAPSTVRVDIITSLNLVEPVVVSGDLDRKNIFFSSSCIKSLDVRRCSNIITYWFTSFPTEGFMWSM